MQNEKAVILTIALTLLLMPLIAQGQPQPPNVPTLGPAIIFSQGDKFTNVTVYSPQNQIYSENQIELLFSAKVVSMFGQFGNVGYKLDQDTILSVNIFINKTVTNASLPEWYYNTTTVYATINLTNLSKGAHNITVYYGWQYLGIPENPSLERFEVYAYDSVEFTIAYSNTPGYTPTSTVTPAPTPTIPEYSIETIVLLATLTAPTVLLLKRKRN